MEVMDLVYVKLKEFVDEMNSSGKLSKPLIVDYFRNKKALRVENASYLLVKQVSDEQDWLNIGATYTILNSNCVIDFITSSIKDYELVRNGVRKLFNGRSLVYKTKDTPDLVLDYPVEVVGAYLRKIEDVNNVVNENMFVKLSDESSGWVVYKDSNGNCYVFLGRGQYMFPLVSNMKDLSDMLKKQYRMVFQVNVKVIKGLNSEY